SADVVFVELVAAAGEEDGAVAVDRADVVFVELVAATRQEDAVAVDGADVVFVALVAATGKERGVAAGEAAEGDGAEAESEDGGEGDLLEVLHCWSVPPVLLPRTVCPGALHTRFIPRL